MRITQKTFSIYFLSFVLLFSLSFREVENFEKAFLPLFSNTDEIITHTGYTLCYSEKNEQAKWVAYRLTKTMCENDTVKRANNFRADPNVRTGSATPDDYKKSGYDRGHLCPAGDMKWSRQAMSESFYMSNMSPQKPGFNRGIWKKLEEKTRNWAIQNEEIFIVTAGVLNDTLPYIGALDHVSVPKYYYKIILDYKQPELKAIGFLMENTVSKNSIFKYAVPIDSIEVLTGVDFFHNLPDSIENILEAERDSLKWK